MPETICPFFMRGNCLAPNIFPKEISSAQITTEGGINLCGVFPGGCERCEIYFAADKSFHFAMVKSEGDRTPYLVHKIG